MIIKRDKQSFFNNCSKKIDVYFCIDISCIMPKVSIIVPIYNVEQYLKECLESLIAQTLQDIEIICINDGSKDCSGKILDEYAAKDSRIKVIHKQNAGYGAACNTGLDTAIGDYIGIIESDDFAAVNMFEDLYNLITENNCDIIKCEWWEYYTKNKKAIKSEQISSMVKPGKISSQEEQKKLLKCPSSVWATLYKKKFLNENKIRFLETPGANYQDISFMLKVVMLAKDIYITNNPYLYYRSDNLNSSVRKKNDGDFIFKEYAEIDNFFIEHSNLKKIYKGSKFYKQYNTYFWNLRRVAPEFKKDIFEKIVKEFQKYNENSELDQYAFEFLSKSRIMTLINKPQKAWKKFKFHAIAISIRELIQSFITIRINHHRIYIRILGSYTFKIGQ